MGRPRYNGKICGAIWRPALTFLTVFAEPVPACPSTPLRLWYIAARRARIVVVIDTICGRLVGLVDGMKIGYFRHVGFLL
jgi:hypothetical protein